MIKIEEREINDAMFLTVFAGSATDEEAYQAYLDKKEELIGRGWNGVSNYSLYVFEQRIVSFEEFHKVFIKAKLDKVLIEADNTTVLNDYVHQVAERKAEWVANQDIETQLSFIKNLGLSEKSILGELIDMLDDLADKEG